MQMNSNSTMELYCKPPQGLNLNGNISENWRKFKVLRYF